MIISRTPFRLSFFGGGTDYPHWYRQHGGAVLSATIDKYCYISCRYLPPFFEHKFRVVYSKIENVSSIEEIQHPSARAVLRHVGLDAGVEVHHDADLPARSGVGSSSVFTVGLLNAASALMGRTLSKRDLAHQSITLEQDVLQETVGSQDQVSAAYGGFNRIMFHPSGDIEVQPVTVAWARLEELSDHLLLAYTGIRRTAADIAATYVHRFEEHASQLHRIRGFVDEALGIVGGSASLGGFGELLHEVWQIKRSLGAAVSNQTIDELYTAARSAGAVGGKLVGAGGGGFLLLFAPPSAHSRIRARLSQLTFSRFSFESGGSQIIFREHPQQVGHA